MLFLYLFRISAVAVYLLCGFFTDNYVLSVRLTLQPDVRAEVADLRVN